MADKADDTVVHFFWCNGIRYVGFVPVNMYFATATTDHYIAIKDLLNRSNIPYWERPQSDNIDRDIYGVEITKGAFDRVNSSVGGSYTQAQMLAFIDAHVNVDIPNQIRDLTAKVDALTDLVKSLIAALPKGTTK